MSQGPKTLFEKVWDSHVVVAPEGEPALLYVDLHLLHADEAQRELVGGGEQRRDAVDDAVCA